jgi:hypothetical protein
MLEAEDSRYLFVYLFRSDKGMRMIKRVFLIARDNGTPPVSEETHAARS